MQMAMYIQVIGRMTREKAKAHLNMQKVESTMVIGITIRGMDMVVLSLKVRYTRL